MTFLSRVRTIVWITRLYGKSLWRNAFSVTVMTLYVKGRRAGIALVAYEAD